MVGAGREIRTMPDDVFAQALSGLPERMAARLAFMSAGHHAVRDFVVREIPRQNRPLSPREIANTTVLNLQKLSLILSDLERNLFFLVRNQGGKVSWAFPVTVSRTAHRLVFSTGERTFGA